ncbi:MAG TPA: adenosylcobinamide-GDP ribazoletransferase [Anaerolineae bacterium]|nr:adenosylcobinamide-GDP ribazoletransferase [Anaerolineae bacterium]
MNDLLAAVSLLTILPIRRELNYSARALAYFPLVGALLGAILVLAQYVLRLLFPPLMVAALLAVLWVLFTSALHLDGVSDSFDGLFAATTQERRLEILRDAHIGAFGASGLVLILILKFAALDDANSSALFLAPILARWAMVYAATFPLAREQGMAALFTNGLTRRELFFATFLTVLFALPFGWLAVSAWIGAVIVAMLLARFAMSRLGGLTGDIYGLICECVEVSVLLVGVAIR